MSKNIKLIKSAHCFWVFTLIVAFLVSGVSAAPRDPGGGNTKMINKLQDMVKEVTTERDSLKAENAKMLADIENLKKDLLKEKDEKTALLASQTKLNSEFSQQTAELAKQKQSSDQVRENLDRHKAKLNEVIEKYNELVKSKNELTVQHAGLQNNQQQVSAELKACESKNIKMYEGAKDVIKGLQQCQKRDILDAIVDSEPFTQVTNVEFETIVQEYEDKLVKQKYQSPIVAKPVGGAPSAPAKAEDAKK